MNARASADSISAVWGLTEAQWLERVRSAEAKLDVCEAERDEVQAVLNGHVFALEKARAERDRAVEFARRVVDEVDPLGPNGDLSQAALALVVATEESNE
jgi:hypothetical protein